MKPDAYLKLYPGDWLKDTLHLDATSTGAYFLLILAHRGKPGIPSDDETLRTIARVKESDWCRVKNQIRQFFQVADGMWINNRSIQDWQRDCAEYQAACERTKNATKARIDNVTKTVTSHVTITQSESESESESKPKSKSESFYVTGVTKRPRIVFVKPTVEEMKEYAPSIGLPEDEAEACFHHYESNGWIVGKNPMKSWKSAMVTWTKNWKEGRYRTQTALPLPPSNGNGISAVQTISLNKELDRCIDAMRVIRGQYESHQQWSKEHADRYKSLIKRKKEIKQLLGTVE